MATTKVDGRRKPLQALEKYVDAAFITDDKPLYFGTDGDTKVMYDASEGVTVISGADIRLSDTAKLTFGSSTVASSDQHMYHYAKAGSDCLVIEGLTGRRVKTGCVFVSDGYLKIVT